MGIWQVAGTAGYPVQVSVQLRSSACGLPVVPAPLLKTLLSPTERFWHICEKPVGQRYVGLVLDSQFLLILYVCLYASTVAL